MKTIHFNYNWHAISIDALCAMLVKSAMSAFAIQGVGRWWHDRVFVAPPRVYAAFIETPGTAIVCATVPLVILLWSVFLFRAGARGRWFVLVYMIAVLWPGVFAVVRYPSSAGTFGAVWLLQLPLIVLYFLDPFSRVSSKS